MDLNNCYLLEYHTGNYEFSYNPREGRGFKHQPGAGGWSPMVVIDREDAAQNSYAAPSGCSRCAPALRLCAKPC